VVKVKEFDIRPHRRCTRTVQFYSPAGANVQLHLIHASFGPPESTSQMASRSVPPFLHSSRHRVSYFTVALLSPFKIAPLHGDLDPIVPRTHLSPQLKRHLSWFSHFCRVHNSDRLRPMTDRPHDYMCNNRPHRLCSTAMRPNDNNLTYIMHNVEGILNRRHAWREADCVGQWPTD